MRHGCFITVLVLRVYISKTGQEQYILILHAHETLSSTEPCQVVSLHQRRDRMAHIRNRQSHDDMLRTTVSSHSSVNPHCLFPIPAFNHTETHIQTFLRKRKSKISTLIYCHHVYIYLYIYPQLPSHTCLHRIRSQHVSIRRHILRSLVTPLPQKPKQRHKDRRATRQKARIIHRRRRHRHRERKAEDNDKDNDIQTSNGVDNIPHSSLHPKPTGRYLGPSTEQVGEDGS